MKKQFLKIATLLLFATVAFSSCSVSYRERRAHDDHHDDHDHHYEEVHHY